jgi:CubicO group peptidase (beta-lactamase class C family)
MDDVANLCRSAALQQVLARHAAAAGGGPVHAAFVCGAAVATANAGGVSERAAPIGCLAKLLTAALVARCAERGELTFDDDVGAQLDADVEALRGVTVRHLLEHTHGLDDSLLAAPHYRNGFIDGADLLARVAPLVRWAAPGAAYSYGNAGAWLLAALLERLRGKPFAALVHGELLAPLGIEGQWHRPRDPQLCAATGAGLLLTAEELARFGLHALEHGRGLALAPITPLPGWHPLERGICRGWKSAGAGWFGHQSAWPGAASYLRVHPQRKLALAVVAQEQSASVVALGMFGTRFPELFEGRKRMPAEMAGGSPLPGVYAQAARAIAIEATPHGLCTEAWERDEHGRQRGARRRARLGRLGGVLLARPASELVPYLEPISAGGPSAWLWNGRFVLRRIG